MYRVCRVRRFHRRERDRKQCATGGEETINQREIPTSRGLECRACAVGAYYYRRMPIVEWDHYTVRSKDAAASQAFYQQALGLNVRKREGFPVPAFIVSIRDREVVHVFQASREMEAIFARMPSSDQLEGWNTGRLHHVEFWATDLNAVRDRLAAHGIQVNERILPDKHQLQMTDPDGIQVNLNFPLSELPRSP